MTNSPEYSELLDRIVKGAEYLDNPLITEIDKKKGMKLYDALVEALEQHRAHERSLGQRDRPA